MTGNCSFKNKVCRYSIVPGVCRGPKSHERSDRASLINANVAKIKKNVGIPSFSLHGK